jgi:hypothetical protein
MFLFIEGGGRVINVASLAGINIYYAWMSNCCLSPNEQFYSYILTGTSDISMTWTRGSSEPVSLVGCSYSVCDKLSLDFEENMFLLIFTKGPMLKL